MQIQLGKFFEFFDDVNVLAIFSMVAVKRIVKPPVDRFHCPSRPSTPHYLRSTFKNHIYRVPKKNLQCDAAGESTSPRTQIGPKGKKQVSSCAKEDKRDTGERNQGGA